MSPSIARLWTTTTSSPSGRNSTCGECMARRIGTRSTPQPGHQSWLVPHGRRRPTKEEIRAPPARLRSRRRPPPRFDRRRNGSRCPDRLRGGCRSPRNRAAALRPASRPPRPVDGRAIGPGPTPHRGRRRPVCHRRGSRHRARERGRALSASQIAVSYPHVLSRSTWSFSLSAPSLSSNHRMCPLGCHHSPAPRVAA